MQGPIRINADQSEESTSRDEGLGLRMLKTRTVLIAGAVDDKLAEKTIAQLLILDADNHDPIRVLITSQGGHVDSGFAIHDMLRFIESPIVTIGAGCEVGPFSHLRADGVGLVRRYSQRRQNSNDRDDDHQLDKRKPAFFSCRKWSLHGADPVPSIYRRLY